jgi:hypothetical protein
MPGRPPANVWGSRTSGSAFVLVDEPAEDFLSLDQVTRVDGGRTLGVVAAIRRALSEGPMRPVAVVVLDAVLEHEAQVPPVDDQEPVETFAQERADPPSA